jgi:hypothetical protein
MQVTFTRIQQRSIESKQTNVAKQNSNIQVGDKV